MLASGMFLVDRYEILAKIGTGGMADVYKAKDHILGRIVAVKVLKAEFSEDVNFVTKFRTEAQSAAGLEHPNIVNIYDVGSENGLHFIVMEHIEGITLKTYIEKKGQLTFKESTSIAIQVARGIETAHNKEITHRDIKPQNIIISTEGKVKVTDFGIARASNSNTISADVMGSVHYASPEQARNGYVDGRSDIYSLGIVMYEMVTGRVPFDGDTTVAVALQHLQEEMVGPSKYAPNLPISYEKIVLKCTQKNPDRRYQNIGELLTDLRKSLITPDEDFVVIAPLATASKTRTIGAEELDLINSMAEETDLEQETHFAGGPELPAHHKKPAKATALEDYDDEYDDDDEDEDDEDTGFMNPKAEKVLTWLGIIVLVLIIALSIYFVRKIVDIFDGGGNTQTESSQTETESETESETETETETETEGIPENMVEMIDIVGMHVDEAKDRLQALGLNIWIGASKKSDLPDGTVLEQDVAEGDLVEKGDTIVVITAGENTSASKQKVPLVVGLPEEDAAQTLKDAKFKVQREYINDDEVREGYVISQTPEYGE
ncbi:MAG: Stk1 family PASTA domain-containing Ser/Thr kinase, partial [Agathobacter sp.]|nr:Stk1 family PASTA domain-containing Ser/Thr kinase [Agathobacter sp.]